MFCFFGIFITFSTVSACFPVRLTFSPSLVLRQHAAFTFERFLADDRLESLHRLTFISAQLTSTPKAYPAESPPLISTSSASAFPVPPNSIKIHNFIPCRPRRLGGGVLRRAGVPSAVEGRRNLPAAAQRGGYWLLQSSR